MCKLGAKVCLFKTYLLVRGVGWSLSMHLARFEVPVGWCPSEAT